MMSFGYAECKSIQHGPRVRGNSHVLSKKFNTACFLLCAQENITGPFQNLKQEFALLPRYVQALAHTCHCVLVQWVERRSLYYRLKLMNVHNSRNIEIQLYYTENKVSYVIWVCPFQINGEPKYMYTYISQYTDTHIFPRMSQ